MAKEKDVLKTTESSTGTPVTEFLDSSFDDSELDFGIENDRKSLSQYPLIKLMQALSPEVQNREFKDIYAGCLINDVTKVSLGEKVTIRVMRAWRSRTKFPPREEGTNTIECSCPTYNEPGEKGTQYGRCDRCLYNNFDTKDHCMAQYQIVAALGDNPYDLYRIILSKTSYKAGSKLGRALQALGSKYRGKPVYMFKVILSAEEATSKMGAKYYVYKLDVVPPKDGEELLPEELEEDFKTSFLEVRDLRQDMLDRHNKQVALQETEAASGHSLGNTMESMGTEVMGDMNLNTSLSDEEIPF